LPDKYLKTPIGNAGPLRCDILDGRVDKIPQRLPTNRRV
jgi:hypothetical protein